MGSDDKLVQTGWLNTHVIHSAIVLDYNNDNDNYYNNNNNNKDESTTLKMQLYPTNLIDGAQCYG